MTLFPLTGDLVCALGWTILHSIWQAFFAFICLKAVLALWPMASARIKYNLSVVSLTGIFTWFVITFFQQVTAFRAARETTETAMQQLQQIAPTTALHIETVYKSQDQLKWLFPRMEDWFPVLVAMYAIGFCLMTIKLFSDLAQLQQIRTTKTSPMDATWEKHLERLAAQLRIPRKVQLLVSGYIQVPVMLGFLKPIILLPVAMVNNLTPVQLEAILLHELAHIKRNDYLLNIFQSIVETILFFNPFVWQISRIIRQEREHCCDDLVVSSIQPLHYAQALVALEEYRLSSNTLAMAAANNKQHLFNRIKRIMEMKTKHLNYSQRLLAVLIIATGIISIAWLNPAKVKATESKQKNAAPVQPSQPTSLGSVKVYTNTREENATWVNAQASDTTWPEPPAPPAPPAEPPTPPTPGDADMQAPPPPPMPPHTKNVIVNTGKFTYRYDSDVQEKKLTKAERAKLQKQIDEAQKTMQKAMAQLKQADLKRIQAESSAALDKVDWKKVNEEVLAAQAEAKAALNSIDWDKMKGDLKEMSGNMREMKYIVDSSNRKHYVANGNMRYHNTNGNFYYVTDGDSIAMAAAERGRIAAEKGRIAAEKARNEMNINRDKMREAREKADFAHTSSNRYHQLIDKLAADNLIDKAKPYKIEYNNNTLRINGNVQPAAVTSKYKSYLTESSLTISGNKTHLDIDASNNN
ncbi:beta-lactamase regulating signal transducer with metallopeptidase domain [Chitinophaga dinghuensis]|uniref:Beta-lactamase regulating signal transducer with metallopeptidase domain n=1 Tax=Chitinophaga dinghuensis TaxID=1539050 RepID=A0A327WFU5_9BACT|nr:M56 family metallopeptidase [Chitinophaga dinghuensis]RAJ88210.1 beta-lactamase regulating signal transducer with metallopeptidase domain [Chitinophaga dinghuensis]